MKLSVRVWILLLCLGLLFPLLLGLGGCSSEPASENRVTSVLLKKGEITVEAVLTRGFLDGYEEKKVYLFELPSFYSTDADLSELDPVGEAKPRPSVTFTLPAFDGVRSRMFSSYLVASYDADTRAYTPLTPPVSLANPEAAAVYAPPADPAETSIKGLISAYPADAVRLGVTHTVVEVRMEELILTGWEEGAVPYIYNGVTRYLSGEALARLDADVGIYTAAGVEVYLRFLLGSPEGHGVPAALYLQNPPSASAEDHAVNMGTPFSAEIMEGFLDFMAARYAAPSDGSGPVEAFILGYRVNNASEHNRAEGAELASYVTNYEKLVRAAHTAMTSHNPEGRVYVSLDHRRTVTDGKGWDVSAFLAAFREEAALRGDYGWHVACELYAASPSVWEENAAADTAHYTVRNLNTLTDLLDGDKYRTASGDPRRLLISGFEIPAVGLGGAPSSEQDNRQAASYAYAYLTCVQNGRVEALIYSTHADASDTAAQTPLCGLWTVTSAGTEAEKTLSPAAARPICDVFKRIDTTESSELSAALTAIMGASYIKLESALAGKASPVTALRASGTLKGYEPEHKRAALLYGFNDGSTQGFESAGGLTYLELTAAETLGINTLHARFDRTSVCEPMGLTVTLSASDLIGGKELIFDLYAGQLASAGESARPTVTLRLTRKAAGAVADGRGEVRCEIPVSEVRSGVWQTASFPISEFTALLDASDEVTLTLTMDYPLGDAPSGSTAHTMGLAGVYITGNTAVSGTPAALVVVIVAVLVLLVAGTVAVLYLRHRRRS